MMAFVSTGLTKLPELSAVAEGLGEESGKRQQLSRPVDDVLEAVANVDGFDKELLSDMGSALQAEQEVDAELGPLDADCLEGESGEAIGRSVNDADGKCRSLSMEAGKAGAVLQHAAMSAAEVIDDCETTVRTMVSQAAPIVQDCANASSRGLISVETAADISGRVVGSLIGAVRGAITNRDSSVGDIVECAVTELECVPEIVPDECPVPAAVDCPVSADCPPETAETEKEPPPPAGKKPMEKPVPQPEPEPAPKPQPEPVPEPPPKPAPDPQSEEECPPEQQPKDTVTKPPGTTAAANVESGISAGLNLAGAIAGGIAVAADITANAAADISGRLDLSLPDCPPPSPDCPPAPQPATQPCPEPEPQPEEQPCPEPEPEPEPVPEPEPAPKPQPQSQPQPEPAPPAEKYANEPEPPPPPKKFDGDAQPLTDDNAGGQPVPHDKPAAPGGSGPDGGGVTSTPSSVPQPQSDAGDTGGSSGVDQADTGSVAGGGEPTEPAVPAESGDSAPEEKDGDVQLPRAGVW